MTLPQLRATTTKERLTEVLRHLLSIRDSIADDTDRIELDLWFSDGVRAKVEIRGLERDA
jgi:hypothetical protein